MERTTLLHNMSAPPKAVITHEAPALQDVAIEFFYEHLNADPQVLLWRLDGDFPPGTPHQAEEELRRRINERAANLPYPAAALVLSGRAQDARRATDLLTICTVLAKSSGRVYLRDKEPNLSRIGYGRAVVLKIPAKCAGESHA